MSEQSRRIAVIGDVGGYVEHLRHALGSLGVTDDAWPGDLHVVQVGDLFGGRADIDVARLVAPHVAAGRWTQLAGNWELFAVGGPIVGRAGRQAHPAALTEFAAWHRDGLVQRAETITSSSGVTGVVTHAGIGRAFWMQDLAGEPDPFRVVGRLNSMPIEQIARPGTMMGCDRESAPGPIWAAAAEVYRDWTACPWPQIHGHTTVWRQKFGWSQFLPHHFHDRCTADRGHVTFVPSDGSPPIIGIDPALWDRSPLGSLRPLVFSTSPAVAETMAAS
jgi:hypothetical protein